MPEVLAVIGARLNSSRLPAKHLLPLHGLPLVERVLQRLQCARTLTRTVLATTADSVNQPLLDWARGRVEVLAYDGDVNDLMGRIDAVVAACDPDYIAYICGDCPLVDPQFIDHALRQLQAAPACDSIRLADGVTSLHEGMHFYSRAGWRKLLGVSTSAMAREHVGYGDKLTPVLNILPIADSGDYSRIRHRISVDTPADYRFMAALYQRWYEQHPPQSIVALAWVQQQLLEDPALAGINRHVQQKQPDRRYQKVSLFCHVSAAIGLGHLRRCSQIANGLQERLGLGTELYVAGEPRPLPWLSGKVSWVADEAAQLQALEADRAALWIIDLHPDFTDMTAWREACARARARGQHLIALDRLEGLLPEADLLFIPGFYTTLQDARVASGWGNYLFQPVVNQPTLPPSLLVLTGGSDALGYGAWLPALLEAQVPAHYRIDWVQGPYAPPPALPATPRWNCLQQVADVPALLATATAVLTCYGVSLFEAVSSGARTLLLPARQIASAAELAALQQLNCCLMAATDAEIGVQLALLLEDSAALTEMRGRALALGQQVDGISRLLEQVQRLLPASTGAVAGQGG